MTSVTTIPTVYATERNQLAANVSAMAGSISTTTAAAALGGRRSLATGRCQARLVPIHSALASPTEVE